jgi:hypothetical protein
MSMKALLISMPQEDQNSMPYAKLLDLRHAAYKDHMGTHEIPTELVAWDGMMRAKYGNHIKVHHNVYDSFLVALMVVRYGEAVEYWPDKFSEEDLKRADAWQRGSTPYGVSYPASGRGLNLALHFMFWAGMAGALASILDNPSSWLFALPLLGTAMTDYLENKFADHLFRTTTFTQPTTLAVALYTAAPGETGGGTEVSGGSYARVSNNPANANWNGTHGNTTGASSGTGGQVTNAGTLTFPTPTANWGTITHFGLLDATSAGNLLSYGALTNAKTVNNGDPAPSFQATALSFTFA